MNQNAQLSFTGSMHKITNPRATRSRLYVFVDGENILENLQNRKSRPHREYRRLIAPLLESLGVKASWSQYAGCSCPCSPGFVLDKLVQLDPADWRGHDLYVTIRGASKNDGTQREL